MAQAATILTSTLKLCDDLETMSVKVVDQWPSAETYQWPGTLANIRSKFAALHDYCSQLREQTASSTQMLSNIFTLQNQESMKQQSEQGLALTKAMKEQSDRVLFLTTSTVDDSATFRVITAITLVFLSFTVVAVSHPFA